MIVYGQLQWTLGGSAHGIFQKTIPAFNWNDRERQ